MTTSLWIQSGVLLVAVLAAYFGFVRTTDKRLTVIENRCVDHAAWGKEITECRLDVQKLQAQNEVFWQVLQPHLGNIIHSPVARDRDALVDKFLNHEITDDEMLELAAMLDEALKGDRWSSEKKFAGALLLGRVVSLIDRRRRARS